MSLKNDRKQYRIAEVGQRPSDPEMLRGIHHVRMGFIDYQLQQPCREAYHAWIQKDQVNYEIGRLLAANVVARFGWKIIRTLVWHDPTVIPYQINALVGSANEDIGRADPLFSIPSIEQVEAKTAGYHGRRGLPNPIPTVCDT